MDIRYTRGNFIIAYSVGIEEVYHIIYEGEQLSCPFDCTGLGTPIYANEMEKDDTGILIPRKTQKIVD